MKTEIEDINHDETKPKQRSGCTEDGNDLAKVIYQPPPPNGGQYPQGQAHGASKNEAEDSQFQRGREMLDQVLPYTVARVPASTHVTLQQASHIVDKLSE